MFRTWYYSKTNLFSLFFVSLLKNDKIVIFVPPFFGIKEYNFNQFFIVLHKKVINTNTEAKLNVKQYYFEFNYINKKLV